MIELPLVFLGGLLGSAHCVGMCGGFALSIGVGARSPASNLRRQLIYTLGRVLTYSFFGVVAGYGGFWLSHRAGTLVNVQAGLSIVAGALLVFQGLLALGVLPRRAFPAISGGGTPCLAGTFVGPFPDIARLDERLARGSLDGFSALRAGVRLPQSCQQFGECRPRIAHDARLRSGDRAEHDSDRSRGSLLSHSSRRHMLRVSAFCVLITGLISLGRGVMFAQFPGSAAHVSCPFCQ